MRRAFAYILDWYLASVFASIPVLLIYGMESGNTSAPKYLAEMSTSGGTIARITAILLAAIYYVIIPTKLNKGQTFGKRLLSIKVVNKDGSDVNFLTMAKRELLGAMIVEGALVCSGDYFRQIIHIFTSDNIYKIIVQLGVVISVISIVIMLVSKEKQMIHDFIGNTKVIELEK